MYESILTLLISSYYPWHDASKDWGDGCFEKAKHWRCKGKQPSFTIMLSSLQLKRPYHLNKVYFLETVIAYFLDFMKISNESLVEWGLLMCRCHDNTSVSITPIVQIFMCGCPYWSNRIVRLYNRTIEEKLKRSNSISLIWLCTSRPCLSMYWTFHAFHSSCLVLLDSTRHLRALLSHLNGFLLSSIMETIQLLLFTKNFRFLLKFL